jgi:endonuclease/exonuclease/phosphatase family metal-dependent hydrolase
MNLRIASYNIHRSVGRDGREDPSRIASVLEELDADVVALQEVGYRAQASGDVLPQLARAMGARAIEGATLLDERGHYGNAVLSRLPIEVVHRLDLSVPLREPRGAIELMIDARGQAMQVIATHLGLRPGERRHQISELLSLLEASAAEVQVLLGDLNEWFLWGRPLRWLHRVFDRMPAPATFPAHRPWLSLDRLWVKPARIVKSLVTHTSPLSRVASDHLPLVAELEI